MFPFGVRSVLVEGGIPQTRIVTEGFGQEKPIAAIETEEGRAENRRLEVVVI